MSCHGIFFGKKARVMVLHAKHIPLSASVFRDRRFTTAYGVVEKADALVHDAPGNASRVAKLTETTIEKKKNFTKGILGPLNFFSRLKSDL